MSLPDSLQASVAMPAQVCCDEWLARWLPMLREACAHGPVLEIGCGEGEDSATLTGAGLELIAFDLSAEAAAAASRRVPGGQFHCQDVRQPFPLNERQPGAVVASLSLHYFPWEETLGIVERIRQCLPPGGKLLCRLNASDDHHYGASGYPEIAPDYYLVDGSPKRFFDERSVRELFANGWRILSLSHHVTGKYGLPKALWEAVLER
ncbi:trans-aconitate 2-methyltransferase [Chromobacterium sp. IIBBL 290-4]|uniref:class I SAM-dependent methyltransferase n=1 Tax=Chromobacterium sp. IIBBL 290-4 TaxID=2953890 RepID=UPI0020B64C88|nr:class I SAM-dependent methyltransferase [Chromobacterium sp. IIBBL 290-4]UTH72903.1 class I SAM-dependent methyltransferase [Chromobacterium sp. IIBBL 290-4]